MSFLNNLQELKRQTSQANLKVSKPYGMHEKITILVGIEMLLSKKETRKHSTHGTAPQHDQDPSLPNQHFSE